MSGALRKRRPFAVSVPVATLEDKRLSWRARGILVGLMAKPDGWDVRSEAIAREGREGREAVRTAIRELYAYGYVRIVRRYSHETSGLITETELSDVPVEAWATEYEESQAVAKAAEKPWRAPILASVESQFLGSTLLDSTSLDSGNPGSLSSTSLTVPANAGTSTQGRDASRSPAHPKGSRLPADWAPDASLRAWTDEHIAGTAVRPGWELDQFRDYWAARPGKDGEKVDWDATWRRWIRETVAKVARAGPVRVSQAPPSEATNAPAYRPVAEVLADLEKAAR